MKLLYREQADKDGRHHIYAVVLDRDVFEFKHTINVPLLEMEIDEVGANSGWYQDMRRSLDKRDAGGNAKYYVLDGKVSEDVEWVEWVDPNDGTEPPPMLEPKEYQVITFAVDTDKARLRELDDQPSMTAADEAEALRLVVKRSVVDVSLSRGAERA